MVLSLILKFCFSACGFYFSWICWRILFGACTKFVFPNKRAAAQPTMQPIEFNLMAMDPLSLAGGGVHGWCHPDPDILPSFLRPFYSCPMDCAGNLPWPILLSTIWLLLRGWQFLEQHFFQNTCTQFDLGEQFCSLFPHSKIQSLSFVSYHFPF